MVIFAISLFVVVSGLVYVRARVHARDEFFRGVTYGREIERIREQLKREAA